MRILTTVLLFLCIMVSTSAYAQADTGALTTEHMEKLIHIIEDEQQRETLLGHLRALREATATTLELDAKSSPGAELLKQLSAKVQSVGSNVIRSIEALRALPNVLGDITASFSRTETRGGWLAALAKIGVVIGGGWLAVLLIRRTLRPARLSLESARREGFWSRLPIQLGRFILDAVVIGVFAVAGYVLLAAVNPGNPTRLIAIALINSTLINRTIWLTARAVLSPHVAGLRLFPINDETANYWMVWVRRLSTFTVYGYVFVETGLLLGFPGALHALLANLLGLGVLLMLLVVVQQNRRSVAEIIGPSAEARGAVNVLRRRLAEIWSVLASLYLVVVFAVWLAKIPEGFVLIARASLLTILILTIAYALASALVRLIDRGFGLGAEMTARFPALEARANRYVPRVIGLAVYVLWGVALLAVLEAWSVNALAWMTGDLMSAAIEHGSTIVFVLLLAVIVWEVVSSVIEIAIARTREDGERSARLETLLPLAQKAILVVLCVMTTLTVLSELGVDIAPLLAGAGVVGLAVGFGAQTLVQDIITGVFILIEDSISVGDFVDVGGHSGTVESLSIRTIRLRDVEGNVHTVPFSSVSTVLNYTRDYGISLIEIGVAYREDIDHVIEVLNELGQEMLQEPELAKDILEPLFVMGVQRLDDSAVTLRARIKTKAGMQWSMRREFFRRMKRRFDERGIEIPFPHRTVYFGVDKDGTAPSAPVRLENTEK